MARPTRPSLPGPPSPLVVVALVALALGSTGCAEAHWPMALDPGSLVSAKPGPDARSRQAPLPSTIADLLALQVGPVAIAHRGMGANLGEDPDRPIENSVRAVIQGYQAGASVVELDLQITGDGEIVAWHDDFLADGTCLNTLTRRQLGRRAPHISSLQAVLQTAIRFNRGHPGQLTGLLTVDLKPPSPLCDPEDRNEAAIVDAVVRIIRQLGATELVYFNGMSPVMLALARERAPEIRRQLTVLALQFLDAEQTEATLGLPVTEIEKPTDFGLRWAEIGPIHRLPGYESPAQALGVAAAVGASIVSWDLLFLGQIEQAQPGSATALVQATRAAGFHAFAGDVSEPAHWHFGSAVGAQALYADDVPLAVSLQPPLD